jgi:LysR family glycine cleavage system transcriptional activator
MQKQKKSMPPLNALKAFEATARLQSLTKASEELHVTQGAVSQQVKLLEEYLGVSLFIRKSRQLQLTDIARSYLTVLTEAFSRVQISTQELFETPHQSFLQVRCGTSFAQRWLVPNLADFTRKHPDYRMRLQTTIWHDGFPLEGIDVEICHGYGNYTGLSVQRILKENWIVVASTEFVQRQNEGVSGDSGNSISDDIGPQYLSLEQIQSAPLISTIGYKEGWNQWFNQLGEHDSQVTSSYESDNSTMALDMTLSGMGVMLGLDSYFCEHLQNGKLVQVHPHTMQAECGLYLVLPLQEIRPKTKNFCLWLFEQMADHPNRDDLQWQHK